MPSKLIERSHLGDCFAHCVSPIRRTEDRGCQSPQLGLSYTALLRRYRDCHELPSVLHPGVCPAVHFGDRAPRRPPHFGCGRRLPAVSSSASASYEVSFSKKPSLRSSVARVKPSAYAADRWVVSRAKHACAAARVCRVGFIQSLQARRHRRGIYGYGWHRQREAHAADGSCL